MKNICIHLKKRIFKRVHTCEKESPCESKFYYGGNIYCKEDSTRGIVRNHDRRVMNDYGYEMGK